MSVRVLFDTNIIMDALLQRHPHDEQAILLLKHIENNTINGLICATTITTISYLLEKIFDKKTTKLILKNLLALFEVAAINRAILEEALKLSFKDYEDAVLHEAARCAGAEMLVTRNPKDFIKASLSILTPQELINLLENPA